MKSPVRSVRLSPFLAGVLLASTGVVRAEVVPPELRVTPEVRTVREEGGGGSSLGLKGGVPLADNNRINGVLTDRLVIVDLVPDDAGQYSARVSHAEGEVTGDEATLGVDDIPSPPNAYFAEANRLSGRRLVTASWNYGASPEVGEPRHGGQPASRSVWWRWTAPNSELVELKTDRSSLDTVLVVYTGPSLARLYGVATNDNDGEWLNSRLVFWAEAGTTYSIAVDGKDGQQGSVWLWLNAEEVSTLMPLDHLGSWPGGNAGSPGMYRSGGTWRACAWWVPERIWASALRGLTSSTSRIRRTRPSLATTVPARPGRTRSMGWVTTPTSRTVGADC